MLYCICDEIMKTRIKGCKYTKDTKDNIQTIFLILNAFKAFRGNHWYETM